MISDDAMSQLPWDVSRYINLRLQRLVPDNLTVLKHSDGKAVTQNAGHR